MRHTINLQFSAGADLDEDPGISKESLTDSFRLMVETTLSLGDKYFKTEGKTAYPDLPNPFDPFESDWEIDPEVIILLVDDAPNFLGELVGGSLPDPSAKERTVRTLRHMRADAISVVRGIDQENGVKFLRVHCLVDFRRIQESARILYGKVDDESYNTAILAAVSHELIGHFPAILKGEETFPPTDQDEIRALERTIAFFEWTLTTVRANPPADPAARVTHARILDGLERALKRERDLLTDHKADPLSP